MLKTITMQAGEPQEFYEVSDFFRVLTASQPLNVTFYRLGKEVARAEGVAGGYAERFMQGQFDRWVITSATTQTVQFVARLGNEIFYDLPPFGNVNGTFSQAQKTVTSASAELAPVNLLRRYLLVQNKDGAGSVYLRFGPDPATTANGVKITPGGSYELQGYVPSNAIQAVGDVASNANIIVIEG